MLIEKEWENFPKPLYLVTARAEWYEEKARGAWAEKTGGCRIQQEKHVRWCVEQLHVGSMLPSHLTDTISVHTVVTEAVASLTLRNSANSKRLVWKGTQRTEPSGVGSTMERGLFPPGVLDSSFRIHLLAFHYELCSFTSLLSHSMENVSMLKNNILLLWLCCCFCFCWWCSITTESHPKPKVTILD